MHDADHIDLDRTADSNLDVDLADLASAAGHAFKPHFDDVVTRAGRRRHVRAVVAAVIAAGVAAGGSTVFAITAGDRAALVSTTPTPSAAPWHTAYVPVPGSAGGPAPQPTWGQVAPGVYGFAAPDKSLTGGILTELKAGDLNHLYLEYQDCAGGTCRRMLASSADRGRTWRKLPMPAGLVSEKPTASIVLVRGSLVVAADNDWPTGVRAGGPPTATYWSSTDGGVTWRHPTVRTVGSLPAGWPVRTEMTSGAVVAVDPATGDVVRISLPRDMSVLVDTPPAAGMWALGYATEAIPSPRPKGFQPQRRRVAMVSRDGGRTWDTRTLPDTATDKDGSSSLFGQALTTADGETVYSAERRDDGVRIYVSTDGARTWQARALIDLHAPLLSLLPVGDGVVLAEAPDGTYRSTDQARTFTRIDPSIGARAYALPGGGFAMPTSNNEYGIWLSPDAASWSYIARPNLP